MTATTPKMSSAEFNHVAQTCKRWSDRSLSVARALLVDGLSLSEAAANHEMSSQQANVTRTRFLAKAEKQRVESFMAREKPKLSTALLEPFAEDMRTLRDKGYTMRQIVLFLREQGIETSVTTVRNFLKE